MKSRFIESGIGFGSSFASISSPISVSSDAIEDLIKKESGGNYKATNPNSSAVGKYQFLWNTWGDKIKNYTGVKSKEEFLNNPNAQDSFFNNYYLPNEVQPAIARVRKSTGTTADDGALTKLIHFRGEGGAKQYLTGKLSDTPEGSNNMAISKYTGIPKMALGGIISTYGAVIQPVTQAIEGDGTNVARSMAAGALQSGVVGAAMKGFQAYQANRIKQQQQQKQNGLDTEIALNNSANSYKQLALNPTGYYANGGVVNNSYEAEKGEVALGDAQLEESKELAPGIQEVGGNSHEEGGTMGKGGNFMFSNRLFLKPVDIELLKTIKLSVSDKTAYSDAAKKVGLIAKKFSYPTNRYRTSNTNKAMLGRVNIILQELAQNQENSKQ